MSKQARAPRSLGIVAESLIGRRITVELRNDAVLSGVLDSVDGKMNLTLDDATYDGEHATRFEKVYVASRHITFMHLPAELDIAQHVDNHVNRLAALRYSSTGGKRRRRE